jgi:hypothetical protein
MYANAAPWGAVDAGDPDNTITGTLVAGDTVAYRLIEEDEFGREVWPCGGLRCGISIEATGASMTVYLLPRRVLNQPEPEWTVFAADVARFDRTPHEGETWFITLEGDGPYTLTHR